MNPRAITPRDAPAAGYRVGSLGKGLAVLRLFDENRPAIRLAEIADATGLSPATAFRVVATLEQEGYLAKTPSGDIHPTALVLRLGYASLSGAGILQASEKPLHDLHLATGERVHLGALLGDKVLYLTRLGAAVGMTHAINPGTTMPAAYTSIGKALLAELDADAYDAFLAGQPFPGGGGPRAVSTRSELDAQLARIRETGYALQDEELAPGLRSVSVVVRSRRGDAVAAVNLAVDAAACGLDRLEGELLDEVRRAAAGITRRLSGPDHR